MIIQNVNYAAIELRTAISIEFVTLRALYKAQEANPFGTSLERQIQGCRARIAKLKFQQHVQDVRDFGT